MASSILCDNHLASATILSEDTLSGFPMANGTNSATALQAGFELGAVRDQVFDFGANRTIDTIAIVKHNLFSSAAQVKLYSGTSGTGPWTLQHNLIMTSNDALMQDVVSFTTAYLKLEVSFPASNCYVGNIAVGQRIDISEGQYVGFVQPDNANKYRVTANITRGGEVSGLLRTPQPIKTKIQGKHLKKSWVDANWPAINECITKNPFYFRWEDSGSTVYCWATKIKPPTWDTISNQSFSLDCEGLV